MNTKERKDKGRELLWSKLTSELSCLNDNNYKARVIYDYIEKFYERRKKI